MFVLTLPRKFALLIALAGLSLIALGGSRSPTSTTR